MNKRVKITSFAAAALATLFLAGINGHSTVKADTTGDTSNSKVEKTIKESAPVKSGTSGQDDENTDDSDTEQNGNGTDTDDSNSGQGAEGQDSEGTNKVTGKTDSGNGSGTNKHWDDDDDNAPIINDDKIDYPPVPAEAKATAGEISIVYDGDTTIKMKPNLTNKDVYSYMSKHTHFYVNGNELSQPKFDNWNTETWLKDASTGIVDQVAPHNRIDGKHSSYKLYPNDIYYFQPAIIGGLEPNKWYKWKYYEYEENGDKEDADGFTINTRLDLISDPNWNIFTSTNLSEEEEALSKRVAFDPDTHYLYQRTGDTGDLPEDVDYDDSDPDFADAVYGGNQTSVISVQIKQDSGADIPYSEDNDYVYTDGEYEPENVDNQVPDSDSQSTDLNSTDTNQSIKQIDPDKLVENQDNQSDSVSAENERENNKDKNASKNLPLMFKKNAIIYNGKGKPVTSKGSYIVASKYMYLNALDGGNKIRIKINGKTVEFYRVGKNEYVKVSDTVKRNTRKISYKAHLIIKKNKKINLVNYLNKNLGKVLTKHKTIRLDRKRKINGSTIYHIKGTKYWIRAKNVKLA